LEANRVFSLFSLPCLKKVVILCSLRGTIETVKMLIRFSADRRLQVREIYGLFEIQRSREGI
ncbi:MAG: hypothetical protein II603_08395, partial [Muribaculaceae bacterium]|nr:hypothetical protein [Muribaculaceae bacterium]